MTDPIRRIGPWQVHRTKVSFKNPWIRVESSDVTHPDGSPGIYGVVRLANLATGVLPIDNDAATWLVGQHRFPFDAYSWELPEGGGAKDVDPQVSAARELEEEAGVKADSWALLGTWPLSNSVTDEIAYGYVAWDTEAGAAAPEPSEELALKRMPFAELVDRCLKGDITDAFTVLMALTALERARRSDLPEPVCALLLRDLD
ncbi:MAG: NUDIX hydrolase [Pseudomonadota bacterium]